MIFDSIKEKFIFYSIPIFLFSLLPFFLITGPLLSDLSISIISLLFITYCIIKKNFSFFNKRYFHIFLIFWVYLVLNSLINNFNLDSIKISFFYFRYGVFVIAIVALLDFDSKFIKYFFYCIFICFTLLIFDGFYQYFVGKNIIGFQSPSKFRVSSFFHEEMILGSYLTRLWPIFFGLSIFIFKKRDNFFLFFVLIFILSESLIFLSGDRVAFFFINLSAFFVIFLSKKLYKLRIFTLLVSILLLVIISFLNPAAKERVFDQTLEHMNLTKKENKIDNQIYIFSKQHTYHYISAYKMFLDNKILGVGVKNFRNFCGKKDYFKNELSCATHPHNTYIQLLSETGIIGFSFILFALFYFLKTTLTHIIYRFNNRQYFSDFEICILSGILIYLWPFVPSGNVFNNWLNIAMILNFPLIIWSIKSDKT